MIRQFVLYETASGRIIQSGTDCAPELLGTSETSVLLDQVAQVEGFYVDDGQIIQKPQKPSQYHKFNYGTKQWEPDLDVAWGQVRIQRQQLLQASDWSTLPDVPLTAEQKAQWVAYRQALRDITNQTDPLNIVWPVAPT